MKKERPSRQGFTMIVALSFLALMVLVATGVLAFGQQQMHAARRTRDYLKAKVIAETGLNIAFNDIRGDVDLITGYNGTKTAFGDGTYAVTITNISTSADGRTRLLRLTSVGRCGIADARASLAVRHIHDTNTSGNPDLDKVLLNALTSQKQIVLNGNPTVVGDIASATRISTSGNAFNVTGTGFTPIFSGRANRFTGGVNTSDPDRYSINWGAVLSMDKYTSKAVTHDGRAFSSYPANTIVYCPNDVSINGGTIQCMIISAKNITIAGNAILRQPGTYPVLVSLNGRITITGTPVVNGFVVSLSGDAPMGKAAGTPTINGSLFIMGGLPDSGNVKINYLPLEIRPPDTPDARDTVEVVAWQ
jgi:hypothetical protein